MKQKKWTNIQASGNNNSVKVPAGGYVFMCTGVEDVSSREYLKLTYDIAEGEYKGAFSKGFAADNDWTHQFVISYSDNAEGLFKRFLECLEASNPSFNVESWEQTSNEQAFVGKLFGAAVGTEKYTSNKTGKDVERWTLPNWWTVEDIRGGHFTCPADKDNRVKSETAPAATPVYNDDLPF